MQSQAALRVSYVLSHSFQSQLAVLRPSFSSTPEAPAADILEGCDWEHAFRTASFCVKAWFKRQDMNIYQKDLKDSMAFIKN